MTTEQFFELPLGVSLTMSEIIEIKDALFTAYHIEENKGLYSCAKTKRELFLKIDTIANNYRKL